MKHRAITTAISCCAIIITAYCQQASATGEPGSQTAEAIDSVAVQYDQLDEFVLEVKKELVTSDGAKLTYDMANDDSSKGQSLLDALRKVPMVSVDGQDNVYIKGSQNFKIYVNGKEDPMLTANAARILKAMPAESVSKIEVITEPGAKYDAEGTAGVLNLITERKQNKDGYTGSASLSYSSQNIGANLYGRVKYDKVMADLSINFANNDLQGMHQDNRTEIIDYSSDNTYRTIDVMKQQMLYNFGNGALNLSWEPNDRDLFTVGASTNLMIMKSKNVTDTRSIFNRQGDLQSQIFQDMKGTIRNVGLNANSSYRRLFTDRGNSMTLTYQFNYGAQPWKLDYQNSTEYGNLYLPTYQSNDIAEYTREHIATADFSNPIGGDKHKLDVGAKGIFRRNNRDTRSYYGESPDDMISVEDGNGTTQQLQDIYAAYLSYNGKLGNVALTGGLRYEHSMMSLRFPMGNYQNFARHLNDVVPNAAVSYMFGPAHNLRLAYQMRINRPSIDQMNPTEFRVTQTIVQVGNPELRSEHFNSVSLTYSNYTSTFGGNVGLTYYQSNNTIERYSYYVDGVNYDTYGNFGHNRKTELSGYFNWNITTKMSMSVNGAVNYTSIRSGDGKLGNHGWQGNYGVNWNYQGPWKMNYYVYGGQSTGNIQLQGKNYGWHYYGLGCSKSLLKDDSLKITLNATNFLTKWFTFKTLTNTGNQVARGNYRNRNWNVGVTLTWNFGHLTDKVKTTGADLKYDDKKSTQSNPNSTGI